MRLLTQLLVLSVRVVWFVMFGLWLGAAYFILMFAMSPFWTLSSTRILENTGNIMLLRTSGGR